MSDVNPHNMTIPELRKWARALCDKWNWNAGLPMIVEELGELEIRSDSRELKILQEEFNKFFNFAESNQADLIKEFLEHNENK